MKEGALSILLIEDNEGDARLIVELLKDAVDFRFNYDNAKTLKEGAEMCHSGHYDIVLLDLSLPDSHGVDTFAQCHQLNEDVPVIVLTGMDNTEMALEAVKKGAQDYLQKMELSTNLLVKSILFAIERKKGEIQLRKLNDELEDKVLERTKELAVALDREKEISEMKSSFVTMASHEFRTPLASILSSANLIGMYADKELYERQPKHIDLIKQSVKSLVDILEDFLSIERIEQGGIESEPEEFDMDQFVNEVLSEVTMITKEGQEIQYTHSGNMHCCQDKNTLRNVLKNLLSNAIKYSDEDIVLDINGDNNKISIQVKDSGIGIPLEDQKNLFEKFFRAKNASNIQGTGLGLNIVKRYVESMRGAISFESEPNAGTTFTVEFPRVYQS